MKMVGNTVDGSVIAVSLTIGNNWNFFLFSFGMIDTFCSSGNEYNSGEKKGNCCFGFFA